jgi:hypothetical protein
LPDIRAKAAIRRPGCKASARPAAERATDSAAGWVSLRSSHHALSIRIGGLSTTGGSIADDNRAHRRSKTILAARRERDSHASPATVACRPKRCRSERAPSMRGAVARFVPNRGAHKNSMTLALRTLHPGRWCGSGGWRCGGAASARADDCVRVGLAESIGNVPWLACVDWPAAIRASAPQRMDRANIMHIAIAVARIGRCASPRFAQEGV